MPALRFRLAWEDYCRFEKALGRKVPMPRRSEKVEVQIPVSDAVYRYFREQRERRRELGEPSTMSDIMTGIVRSGIVENLMAPNWREHVARYKEPYGA